MMPKSNFPAQPQPRIQEKDRRYFKEIFKLNSFKKQGFTEDLIDLEGLNKIFEMVGFTPNKKQEREFEEMFAQEGSITF